MASVSAYLRQNVLGLVAIFLALNAGAYAVTTSGDETGKTVFNQDLGNASVDSRVLAEGAVAGPDIHSAAVGPKKLKLDQLVKYLQTRVNAQCADGETVQGILADGSVLCAADDVNPGTITGVTTSGGLTGGGTAGSVNVGVDPSVIQQRVTGTCSGNQAVQSVGQTGGVGCQAIAAKRPRRRRPDRHVSEPDPGQRVDRRGQPVHQQPSGRRRRNPDAAQPRQRSRPGRCRQRPAAV